MRRRLILSTGLIALAAVLVLGIPLGLVQASRARADAIARLEREADAVAAAVDEPAEDGGSITPALIAPYVRPGHRAVVQLPGGRPIAVGRVAGDDVLTVSSAAAQAARVTASAPGEERERRVWGAWLLIGGLGAGAVAAATGLAALQARRLARPLEGVAEASRRLGAGDFTARAGRSGIPEIDEVAVALDAGAERIGALVAREREFSGNASHQLRTPLTALRLRLEEVAALDDPAARRAEADLALAEADRLDATIEVLLRHARGGEEDAARSVDLDAVADVVAGRWRRALRAAGRPLEVAPGLGGALAAGSEVTAGQVLDVLLENALRHGAGTVRVSTSRAAGAVVLAVGDEGGGVATDAGDVFARGTSRADGPGIGLHLARALAEADGGHLVLAAAAPPRFELRLRPA